MIYIKTEEELKIMRKAGKILAEIGEEIYKEVKPGVNTKYLDEVALELCKKYDVEPAFLNYNDYPAVLCVGVEDVAIHGIPNQKEILNEGEIISVDMGIKYKGYYSDKAVTLAVGEVDSEARRLLDITKLSLMTSIKQAVDGNTVGDVSYAMEQVVDIAGFSVITEMVGHGVGKSLHEEPQVPCFGDKGQGPKLKSGMVIAIEAMVNEGQSELVFEDDGWTTRTKDGKRSAIFEHTVAVGSKNAEILTII